MRPPLILLHGWGFDTRLWDKLAEALAEYSIVRWNRGYFGEPEECSVTGSVVGIGHSLGAMLLADRLPPGASLIAINGFDHFTGPGGVSPRVVERMQARFAETPADVLTDFRARCGAPPSTVAPQTERLAADLALLATHRAVPRPRRMLSLQGGWDPILPECLRGEVFPGAARATLGQAGHLLPMTHTAWCAAEIEAFLCR
jgi:pimeloyl-[acyl-carrier protein] methyl ester esterase